VAAIFMLVGLGTYLSGYRYLPSKVERLSREGDRLSRRDWRIMGALIAVIAITIFQSIAYYQIFNVGPVWTQQYVSANVGSFRMPVPWYQSINALFCILGVPLLFWIWRRQASRGREPHDVTKIGIGAGLAAVSNLLLVAAILLSKGAPINPIWLFLYCFVLAISFLYYWPTLLALVSRAAPAKVNATMMGITFLSLFISNSIIGWVGSFYERMRPIEFWALPAAIAAIGGVLVILFGQRLRRALDPV
jgi:POT family proton-dependent oligopeptide transporter